MALLFKVAAPHWDSDCASLNTSPHGTQAKDIILCCLLVLLDACAGAADIPHIPADTYAVLVSGTFKASKGRDAAEHANNVLLLLAVLRFPQHAADLLVSVNAPVFVSGGSSAGIQGGEQPAAQGQAVGVMEGVLRGLTVEDWGLFGG